jgi:hypothetical protein
MRRRFRSQHNLPAKPRSTVSLKTQGRPPSFEPVPRGETMSRNALYCVVVVAFALLSTPVAAEEHAGSGSEQDACRRDVVKLCKGVAPEDGPILNCLKTYRVKLSAHCRTVLESHGQ